MLLHSWKAPGASDEHTLIYKRSWLHTFWQTASVHLTFANYISCLLFKRKTEKQRERERARVQKATINLAVFLQSVTEQHVKDAFIWRAGFILNDLEGSGLCHLWMLRGLCFFSSTLKICSSRHVRLTSAKTLLSVSLSLSAAWSWPEPSLNQSDFKTDIINHWHEMQQIQTSCYHVHKLMWLMCVTLLNLWSKSGVANGVSLVCFTN